MNFGTNVASFDARPLGSTVFAVIDVRKRTLEEQLQERQNSGWESNGQTPLPYGNGRRVRRYGENIHEVTHMRVTLNKVR